MSKSSVLVVDYGVGNLRSVVRALEKTGANVSLSSHAKDISNASRVVLPGVGAFGHCVDELKKRNLFSALIEYLNLDRPFLGICVGMQLLLGKSDEFGNYEGFSFIDGHVRKIPIDDYPEKGIKLPHIGWNKLSFSRPDDPLLKGLSPVEFFYFLHSYQGSVDQEDNVLGYADYLGIKISSILKKGNVYGCQFHPEKSGPAGLMFLKNFCEL